MSEAVRPLPFLKGRLYLLKNNKTNIYFCWGEYVKYFAMQKNTYSPRTLGEYVFCIDKYFDVFTSTKVNICIVFHIRDLGVFADNWR